MFCISAALSDNTTKQPAKTPVLHSSDKREKLEAGTFLSCLVVEVFLVTVYFLLTTGEQVLMPGSGPHPYVLQKKGNVYCCSCSIWRHIDEIEQRRTCRHLRQLRGEKAETGRVGEDGIRKSEEKLKELLEADHRMRQMAAAAQRPPSHASSSGSALGKRPWNPAEPECAAAAAAKMPLMP